MLYGNDITKPQFLLQTKTKYLQLSLKIIFGLIVFAFVIWKITQAFDSNWLKKVNFHPNTVFFLCIVGFLMILNWSVEGLKWKRLVRSLEKLSFITALKGVLAGLSTGILTPNRLGNFIGRTLMLHPENRLKATLLTLLANLAQFIVTVFFGAVGLLIIGVSFFTYSTPVIIICAFFLMLLALAIYLQPYLINRRPFNYFFTDRIVEGIGFISEESMRLKLEILALSILRYFIFVSQYVLLLVVFNQHESLAVLFAYISVVYLLMTLIPSLFFGKLFVREAAGLFVLSQLGVPDTVIILTGFVLWFINIALPSLIGASFLIGKK